MTYTGAVMIGLNSVDDHDRPNDIDYAILASGADHTLYSYENDDYTGPLGSFDDGDVLRVAVIGTQIRYYRNGVLLGVSTVARNNPLFMDAALFGDYSQVINARICDGALVVNNSPTRTATGTRTPTPTPGPRNCQTFTWIDQVNTQVSGTVLTKISGGGGWNAGAASGKAIKTGRGSVEAIIPDTNHYALFGLGNGDTNATYQDVDFGIETYWPANQLWIREGGVIKGKFHGYAAGDKLSLVIVDGRILYYRNADLLMESATTASYPLWIDTSFYDVGASIRDARLCANPLVNVPSYTPTRTPTLARTYTPTRTPTRTSTITLTRTPTQIPAPGTCQSFTWIDQVNVTVGNANALSKTAGGGGWNAGAVSNKAFPAGQNGAAQITVANVNHYALFGLSNGNSSATQTDIDFGIETYYPDNQLWIWENGVVKAKIAGYAGGDVLRVAAYGNSVRYYRNGAVIYTSAATPTYPLLFDSSFYDVGGQIKNPQLCSGPLIGVASQTPTITRTPTRTATTTRTRTPTHTP